MLFMLCVRRPLTRNASLAASGPDVGGPAEPYRQSERTQIYKSYVDRLVEAGVVRVAVHTLGSPLARGCACDAFGCGSRDSSRSSAPLACTRREEGCRVRGRGWGAGGAPWLC